MSSPMVRAILDGTKTQTRRVIKPQPDNVEVIDGAIIWTPDVVKPKYDQGDILWVRETFAHNKQVQISPTYNEYGYVYKATDPEWEDYLGWKWTPSLFMPKKACRIWLKVTGIYVQRLHEISENDAIAEGIEKSGKSLFKDYYTNRPGFENPIHSFRSLWQSIHKKDTWNDNPFVWVYTFETCEKPPHFLCY